VSIDALLRVRQNFTSTRMNPIVVVPTFSEVPHSAFNWSWSSYARVLLAVPVDLAYSLV
jgi:hypothetical protein